MCLSFPQPKPFMAVAEMKSTPSSSSLLLRNMYTCGRQHDSAMETCTQTAFFLIGDIIFPCMESSVHKNSSLINQGMFDKISLAAG